MGMSNYGFKDSSAAGNNYTFHCPVVGRDVRYIVCAFKKAKHWRGEKFADQDCHVLMNASKCPAIHMQKKEWATSERMFWSESTEPKKLPIDIADRINRLLVIPGHLNGYNPTTEQRERLLENAPLDASLISSKTAQPTRSPSKSRVAVTASESVSLLDAGLAQVHIDTSELLNQSLAINAAKE